MTILLMMYHKIPHSGSLSSGCSKIGLLKDEFKIAEEYHNLRERDTLRDIRHHAMNQK